MNFPSLVTWLWLITITGSLRKATAFNLYPSANATALADVFNVTLDCLEALNQTLPECDDTLFHMALDVDHYWWDDDNVTALCAGNCSLAASYWDLNVAGACDGQYYPAYGKMIPWSTVTARYLDGVNLACLGSSTDDSWCLVESQDWVGSAPYYPDCSADPSDPACADNGTALVPSYQRLANLYEDDVLCNDCFIKTLYQRVMSPFLPDNDYSDFLVDQLQDIGDICSTSIPDITVRALPTYDPIPTATTSSAVTTTGSATPTTTAICSGQQVSGSDCNDLSAQFNVTTGDLKAYSQSETCEFSAPACLPAGCELQQVRSGDSCASLAAGSPGNVTLVQFLRWNINILGLCDTPTVGQYVCIGAPGGKYILGAPPLGDDGDTGNGQRGGSGDTEPSNSTTTGPTSTPTTTSPSKTTVTPPGETQAGIDPDCNKYAQAPKDGNCASFAADNGISPSQLYAWNTVLGSDGASCNTAFWASEYYCVGVSGSTTANTATSTAGAPGPTQAGIVSNCNKYAQAPKDGSCAGFAAANGISTSQLYAWNSILGANGASCGTSFWAEEYYCVGISGSTTVTTTSVTSASGAPGPTQAGIVSTCNKYATPADGDGCEQFASSNGITPTQLYTWNPVLGAKGVNCGTQFWLEEYYCVGVTK